MSLQLNYGLYLLTKQSQNVKVLKELLQFVKTVAPSRCISFSYIEAETSLHPELSLWENLQLEAEVRTWSELEKCLKPEQSALAKFLSSPDKKCRDSESWEKIVTSLLKGLMSSSQNLLIDMNEELLSPFLIRSFKKTVLEATASKNVYLATANTSFWLDCAHTLVGRKEYRFELTTLSQGTLKKYWAA